MKNNDINAGAEAFRKHGKNAVNPHNKMLARKRHDDWNKGWSQANSFAHSPQAYMEPMVRIDLSFCGIYMGGRRYAL